MSDTLGAVLIGRNEGERLVAALRAVAGAVGTVVYVDSGSTDGSVDAAQAVGAEVVGLDTSRGFTAARARNAGFTRLREVAPAVKYAQFLDGDCEVVPGWLDAARAALDADGQLAVVCGRRRERYPEASLYNAAIDREWDTPVGPADSCGGDAMIRVEALAAVGAYDASVIAGEEPEMCTRLRRAGWRIERLDHEMTRHDAALTRLGQWWKRGVRTGVGGTDVMVRTWSGGRLFAPVVFRALFWTVGWIGALVLLPGLAGWVVGPVVGAGLGLGLACLPLLQTLRMALREARRPGVTRSRGLGFAALSWVDKWSCAAGVLKYLSRRLTGRGLTIVEYKTGGQAEDPAPEAEAQA